MKNISEKSLRTLLDGVFRHYEVTDKDIKVIVDGLVEPTLRGIDTHGIRLTETYVNEIEGGRSNRFPNFSEISSKGAMSVIDADNALGLIAGKTAMDRAICLAKDFGISAVGVKNSNHFGAASYYTLQAAKNNMIGLCVSNADALVAPHNGLNKLLGTNPISFAAPADGDFSFCLDMATSQISYSKVKNYLKNDKIIEQHWAIDDQGRDSSLTRKVNALLPLGGYKGQGLGMMVQVLAGVLMGMPFDHELTHLYEEPYSEPRRIGHFFIAINIGDFLDISAFKETMSKLFHVYNSSESRGDTKIYIPGEKEKESESNRKMFGIPLSQEEYIYFEKWAKKLNLEMELM